ncbi:hypothetical protein G5714_014194 [Onychostoma macrolepis]|uniref:Myb/SANT-like DNA-binding domain-containing protein n=1 Tax=Onychostoma macrolepis TaxID=369639 RepID=A0A7J6CE00_9TELE|nr:hypothetical protein G5714_014194 [Onychostoma macrolepis]
MDDKKRNKNFTRQEMGVLIEEISARKKVLLGRLDNSISMQSKRHAWERVAEAVSAVANSLRDVDGVKKKWADLKSAVKKKGAERSREQKMTGGGSPSIILDAFEEKVLSVIGDTAVTGIKSGVDTEEVAELNVAVMVKSMKGRCFCKSRQQIGGEEKRTGAIGLGQAGLAGRMLGTKGREVQCWQPNYSSPRAQWLSLERISTVSQRTG